MSHVFYFHSFSQLIIEHIMYIIFAILEVISLLFTRFFKSLSVLSLHILHDNSNSRFRWTAFKALIEFFTNTDRKVDSAFILG